MTISQPFVQGGFLDYLEHLGAATVLVADAALSPMLVGILWTADGSGKPTKAAGDLMALLKARRAMLQASLDTEQAADELRRYQKFVKPGQPSPHIVGLRQKQAAARRATSVSKQSFIQAATAFVRNAGIDIPPRVALEASIDSWIDANVPKDA